MTGQVLGAAGRSLVDAKWAKNSKVAEIGRKAEEHTGRTLIELAQTGPTILNDLRIPIPGFQANIDHVVVFGNQILLIDTKYWRTSFYWTVAGRTRRGLQLFPEGDKKTLNAAHEGVNRYLRSSGIADFQIVNSLLVVWSKGKPSLALYRPHMARAVQGRSLLGKLKRITKGQRARADITLALSTLLNPED
ncbi:nuclease-related domain-containing protein [Lysinibacter cavernae]|uniref:nuclease-related domain-containing protein n=1 Tax=Lysinibacter cavernae TaxID=1640652 RepID=UPI003616BAAF